MRNFLKAEAYYVTKDPMFKGISLLCCLEVPYYWFGRGYK